MEFFISEDCLVNKYIPFQEDIFITSANSTENCLEISLCLDSVFSQRESGHFLRELVSGDSRR